MKGIKKILLGLLLLVSTLSLSQGFTMGNRVLMSGVSIPAPPINSFTLTSISILSSWSPSQVINPGTTLDWTVSGGVTIAKTTINDPTFNFSTNTGIADVLVENIEDVTHFNIPNLNITSLDLTEGVSLERIFINDNSISNLDLSGNTALYWLYAVNNSLTSVDLSLNTIVELITLDNNFITSLDLTNNTIVWNVSAINNSLTSVNTTGITSLITLLINSNSLTSIDVITNTALSDLGIHNNSFTSTATNQLLADLVANGLNSGILTYDRNETGQGITDRATLITRSWSITDY